MDTATGMFRSSRRGTLVLAFALTLPLVLAGCVALPELDGPAGEQPVAEQPGASTDADGADESVDDADDVPATQAESCDWESPKLSAGLPAIPQNGEGDLTTIIVGAWQHTHFDTGGGYEAATNDHRYIFPSSDRVLYCQHVPGITDHAENSADFTWDDTRIVLPGGAPGFVVLSWDADTMVWLNRADDSHYLLQRR